MDASTIFIIHNGKEPATRYSWKNSTGDIIWLILGFTRTYARKSAVGSIVQSKDGSMFHFANLGTKLLQLSHTGNGICTRKSPNVIVSNKY